MGGSIVPFNAEELIQFKKPEAIITEGHKVLRASTKKLAQKFIQSLCLNSKRNI